MKPLCIDLFCGLGGPARKNDGVNGGSWFAVAHNTTSGHSKNPVNGCKVPGFNFHEHEKTGKPGRSFQSAAVHGTKVKRNIGRGWFGEYGAENDHAIRNTSSRSNARKQASALIAKIPFPLAQHIARCFHP